MIAPSLTNVGSSASRMSCDEFARTLMTSAAFNTLPLEIHGMTTNVMRRAR
jgi:putative spermidine/putrescine transport system permease protein